MSGLSVSLTQVNADIAAAQAAADAAGLGVGQSWQDVSGSRAKGTIYTNTSGKAILVSVSSTAHGSNTQCNIDIDGVEIERSQSGGGSSNVSSVQALVPDGSTYEVNGNGNFSVGTWMELK